MTIAYLPSHKLGPVGQHTSAEVLARFPSLSYRQLHYWTRLGLVGPTEGPGSGYLSMYTAEEVAVIGLMTDLIHAGMTPRPAAKMARDLIATGSTTLAGIRLDLPVDP